MNGTRASVVDGNLENGEGTGELLVLVRTSASLWIVMGGGFAFAPVIGARKHAKSGSRGGKSGGELPLLNIIVFAGGSLAMLAMGIVSERMDVCGEFIGVVEQVTLVLSDEKLSLASSVVGVEMVVAPVETTCATVRECLSSSN